MKRSIATAGIVVLGACASAGNRTLKDETEKSVSARYGHSASTVVNTARSKSWTYPGFKSPSGQFGEVVGNDVCSSAASCTN